MTGVHRGISLATVSLLSVFIFALSTATAYAQQSAASAAADAICDPTKYDPNLDYPRVNPRTGKQGLIGLPCDDKRDCPTGIIKGLCQAPLKCDAITTCEGKAPEGPGVPVQTNPANPANSQPTTQPSVMPTQIGSNPAGSPGQPATNLNSDLLNPTPSSQQQAPLEGGATGGSNTLQGIENFAKNEWNTIFNPTPTAGQGNGFQSSGDLQNAAQVTIQPVPGNEQPSNAASFQSGQQTFGSDTFQPQNVENPAVSDLSNEATPNVQQSQSACGDYDFICKAQQALGYAPQQEQAFQPNSEPATVQPIDGGFCFSDGRGCVTGVKAVDAEKVMSDPRYSTPVQGTASVYNDSTVASKVPGGAQDNPFLAASPYLPSGTLIEVCGPKNCINNVVGDFGPSPSLGRVVDLTPASASEIGINGLGQVQVNVLGYLSGDSTRNNVVTGLNAADLMNAGTSVDAAVSQASAGTRTAFIAADTFSQSSVASLPTSNWNVTGGTNLPSFSQVGNSIAYSVDAYPSTLSGGFDTAPRSGSDILSADSADQRLQPASENTPLPTSRPTDIPINGADQRTGSEILANTSDQRLSPSSGEIPAGSKTGVGSEILASNADQRYQIAPGEIPANSTVGVGGEVLAGNSVTDERLQTSRDIITPVQQGNLPDITPVANNDAQTPVPGTASPESAGSSGLRTVTSAQDFQNLANTTSNIVSSVVDTTKSWWNAANNYLSGSPVEPSNPLAGAIGNPTGDYVPGLNQQPTLPLDTGAPSQGLSGGTISNSTLAGQTPGAPAFEQYPQDAFGSIPTANTPINGADVRTGSDINAPLPAGVTDSRTNLAAGEVPPNTQGGIGSDQVASIRDQNAVPQTPASSETVDGRNWWQRNAPSWLGGQAAPTPVGQGGIGSDAVSSGLAGTPAPAPASDITAPLNNATDPRLQPAPNPASEINAPLTNAADPRLQPVQEAVPLPTARPTDLPINGADVRTGSDINAPLPAGVTDSRTNLAAGEVPPNTQGGIGSDQVASIRDQNAVPQTPASSETVDGRNWWQRNAPSWLGGQAAPTPVGQGGIGSDYASSGGISANSNNEQQPTTPPQTQTLPANTPDILAATPATDQRLAPSQTISYDASSPIAKTGIDGLVNSALPQAEGQSAGAKAQIADAMRQTLVDNPDVLQQFAPGARIVGNDVVFPNNGTINMAALQDQNFQNDMADNLTAEKTYISGSNTADSIKEWVAQFGAAPTPAVAPSVQSPASEPAAQSFSISQPSTWIPSLSNWITSINPSAGDIGNPAGEIVPAPASPSNAGAAPAPASDITAPLNNATDPRLQPAPNPASEINAPLTNATDPRLQPASPSQPSTPATDSGNSAPAPLTPVQQQAQRVQNAFNATYSSYKAFVSNPTDQTMSNLMQNVQRTQSLGGQFPDSTVQGITVQLAGMQRASGLNPDYVAGILSSYNDEIIGGLKTAQRTLQGYLKR